MTGKTAPRRIAHAAVTSSWSEWPFVMSCAECGLYGARCYPFPSFEDADLFEDPESVRYGVTIGTVWCQRCDPPWGEALLQMMTVTSAHWHPGTDAIGPALPLLGGYPAEAIAFLESELADFFDGPGPLSRGRPGWLGEGRVAPRSDDFWFACADLVQWMRERRGIGVLSFATRVAS